MATHHYQPDHYFNTLGSHDPVLRVAPGDTVITTTVDARGDDHEGKRVAKPGNPQTGPFYVEGAVPGDTTAVRFQHLWPNRRRGWSSTRLAPHVVDAWQVLEFPRHAELAPWDLDLERGTACIADPSSPLASLELPLAPMVGCFGVAPADGEAISTATSGRHGGNMDYRGFRQGVTVYFPVEVPGALFFLGDGHALQGDGEIAGTGIEVSFDVQFQVDVVKGRRTWWPRAENATHIFTVGNARPLDQALQHATSEMLTWLTREMELQETAAHALLGQCVEYDLGNVFDPAYTMVCKLSKHVLSQLGKSAHME